IRRHGRVVPYVVALECDALAVDDGIAAAADTEIDLRGIVPDRLRAFARFQHVERDLHAGASPRPGAVALGCTIKLERRPFAGAGKLASRSTSASMRAFEMIMAGHSSSLAAGAPVLSTNFAVVSVMTSYLRALRSLSTD